MFVWKKPQGRTYRYCSDITRFSLEYYIYYNSSNVREIYFCTLMIARQKEPVPERGDNLHLCPYYHIITQAELWVVTLLTLFPLATS